MAGQFFHKPEPKHGSFRGVMKDMQADQTSEEILLSSIEDFVFFGLLHFVIEIRYRTVVAFCQGCWREPQVAVGKDNSIHAEADAGSPPVAISILMFWR